MTRARALVGAVGIAVAAPACGAPAVADDGPSMDAGNVAPAPFAIVTSEATRDALGTNPCYFRAPYDPLDAVFLILANEPITCDDTLPRAMHAKSCNRRALSWQVCIALRPSDLTPRTIALGSDGPSAAWGYDGGCSDTCCNGRGLISEGTLTIDEVGPESVAFALEDTAGPYEAEGQVAPDGEHVARRCP